MMSFDEAVTALQERTKLPRDRAAEIIRQDPLYRTPAPQLDTLAADALEDEHVTEGERIMKALGFTAIHFSQKKHAKVTAGIPDRRYYHRRRRLFVWWEAKAAWGRQSPAQREFQLMCDDSGDPYVLGTLDALKQWLVDNQVATFDESGLPQPIPIS